MKAVSKAVPARSDPGARTDTASEDSKNGWPTGWSYGNFNTLGKVI